MPLTPEAQSLRGLPGVAVAPGRMAGLEKVDEPLRTDVFSQVGAVTTEKVERLFREAAIPVLPFDPERSLKPRHASFGVQIYISSVTESGAVAMTVHSTLCQMARAVCAGDLLYPATWARIATGLTQFETMGEVLRETLHRHLAEFIEDWHRAQLPEFGAD